MTALKDICQAIRTTITVKIRIRAGMRSGAVRATVMAKHTMVSTPDKTNPVGQYPDPERGDELKDDGRRHILHTVGQPQGEPPEHRTDNHAPGHCEQESGRNRSDRKAISRDGSYGEAIDQERAGVIQQTLAFEDRQDAMRWSQLTKHGSRGCGVGGCDDGAERNRRRP